MTNQPAEETILGVNIDGGTNQDSIDNYVETLVGEGKKYKTVEELARAYVNADLHINELKTDLDSRKKKDNDLDEIVSILRNQSPPQAPASQVPAQPQPQVAMKPEDITKSVRTELDRIEAEKRKTYNQSESMRLLSEKYGSQDAAVLAIKKVISGDDTIKEVVNRLGGTNPEALLKFMVSQLPELSAGPNTPGVTPQGSAAVLAPSGRGLSWSEAQQVRKDNPKLYKSPEFRQKLEQAAAAAQRRGVDFYKT